MAERWELSENLSRHAASLGRAQGDPITELIRDAGGGRAEVYEFDPLRREYEAAWENPANRQRPEMTLLIWDKNCKRCYGVDYPFMRRLNFDGATITFLYDGILFILKGRNLRGLYIRLSDKKPKHLREFNPDFHAAPDEGAACIEEVIVKREQDEEPS